MRELAWNHPVVANAARELHFVEAGALNSEPGREHGAEQGPCHDRRVQRWVLVAEWNHGPCWRACVRNVTDQRPVAAKLAQAFGPRLALPRRHRRSQWVSQYA